MACKSIYIIITIMITITMYEDCVCLRCGRRWQPRIETKPVQCPRCKSPFWSEPTKRSLGSLDVGVSDSDVNPAVLDAVEKIASPPAGAKDDLERLGVELICDTESDVAVDPEKSDALPAAMEVDSLDIAYVSLDGSEPNPDSDDSNLTVIGSELGLDYEGTKKVKTTLIYSDSEKPTDSSDPKKSEKKIAPQTGDDTDDLLIISDGEKIASVSKSDVSKAVKDIGAPSPGSQDDLDRLKVELFDAVGALPLSPDDAEPPKGYWKCPHCKALNETENKTGVCSTCGKLVEV